MNKIYGLTTGQRISTAHSIAFEAVHHYCGGSYYQRIHTQDLARTMTLEDARTALEALSDSVKPADLPARAYTEFQNRLVEAENFLY